MPPAVTRVVAVVAFVTVGAISADGWAIMRRHDVPDSEYVVPADKHPAVVDLLEPGDCLATLIAPGWLLTAAHCAADVPTPHAVDIGSERVRVDGVVCHPDYRGWDHDLALVRLEKPVADVTPLPFYRDRDEVGQTVLFVGRGDHGTGEEGQVRAENDGLTREATNTVQGADDLWLELIFHGPGDPEVTEREGISGDGDSGGPALVAAPTGLHVVGISSWQDADEPNVGFYGVHEYYTRVSSYAEFIDETTGPEWDGTLRPCPAEEDDGCSAAPSPPSHHAPTFVLLALIWLQRRRPPLFRRRPLSTEAAHAIADEIEDKLRDELFIGSFWHSAHQRVRQRNVKSGVR